VVSFCSSIYQRNKVIFLVVPSGSVFRLCGRLLHISFLDHKGVIIEEPSEKWDTKSNCCFFVTFNILIVEYFILETKTNRPIDGFVQSPDLNSSIVMSSTTGSSTNNIQYAVFCSSKQARVYFIK
jgi:hypothetical protein